MLLARSGVRVALVDRGRYGSDTLSTHGLMRAGVLQLSRWGLLDECRRRGHSCDPAYEVPLRARRDDRRRRSVPAPGSRRCMPRGATSSTGCWSTRPPRPAPRCCTGTPSPRCSRSGDRVAGVRAQDAQRTRGGAEGGHDGGRRRHPVDRRGRHRRTRPTSGAQRPGRCCTATSTGLDTDGYEWAYGDGAAAGLIPTNDGLTCVFVGTSPHRMRALRQDRGRERRSGSARAVARRAARARCRAPYPWGGCTAGRVSRATSGAAGGRAGHWSGMPATSRTRSPRTASPTRFATRSCSVDALLDSLAGGVPERESLGRYQATRDRLSSRLFAATEAVAAYDWDSESVHRLVREVSAAMGDEVELLQSRALRALERPSASMPVRATD